MRLLASSLARFAVLPLLVAAASAGAATGTTQIVQQRLSDGRILLTDRPVRGAATERSWQMANEDPVAARQRAADVRAEAKEVSERIQRMLEQDRRADEARAQTRLAALAMARQGETSDEPVYYGGYGFGVGVGNGFAFRRGHGHAHGQVAHRGKFGVPDKWGSTERFGTVGRMPTAKGPRPVR